MSVATDEDYQRAAEIFVDALLDPRKPWIARWVLYKKTFYKFLPIPSWQQIEDGSLAAAIYQGTDADYMIEEWFYDALVGKDRETLVQWFKEETKHRGLTKDELARLLACTDIKKVKRSLDRTAEPFKFQPGPSPPTQGQYSAALKLASTLQPVLARFLQQKSSGTKNTTSDILQFISRDFPKECEFLIANLPILEACLRDHRLQQRAKGIRARSRILADAVSGSVHLNRKPSTASEYLSAERLRRHKSRTEIR